MRSHTQRVKIGVLPLNGKKDNNSPARQTGKENNVGVHVFCSGVLRITVVLDLQLEVCNHAPEVPLLIIIFQNAP